MKTILSNRSIIQSTLFNITVSVFITVIILMVFFGQSFWQKEYLRLDYQLLNLAYNVERKISSHKALPQEDSVLPDWRKIDILESTIRPILEENESYNIVYYDRATEWLVTGKWGRDYLKVSDILPALNKIYEVQHISIGNISLVSVPVYQNGVCIGFVWAYAEKPEFELASFVNISTFFILMFALLVIIIFIIRKYMRKIQERLEDFSNTILQNTGKLEWRFEGLPELEPIFTKITAYTEELNRINKELESSQRKTNQIMAGISDGLFSIDKGMNLLYYNDVTKKLLDKDDEELAGKNLAEVIPGFSKSKYERAIKRVLKSKEKSTYEEVDSPLDPEVYYHVSVYPFEEGVTIFFRDITKLREQQAQMDRLERLNLIGQLAAGISHEIRNPLTTVKGFLQLRSIKTGDPKEKEYYDLMISEIDRANTIISDFLSLAKSHDGELREEEDLNQLIYRIFPMIQADAITSNKEIILNLNPLSPIMLNENEIRQLLLNLVRNALEVTPEHGSVIIRTYREGDNTVLAVQDQGEGIPEEIREQIGTPFFTTKESGTGLGLAISMKIAERHNAELVFDTGKDGTTFKVIFRRPLKIRRGNRKGN